MLVLFCSGGFLENPGTRSYITGGGVVFPAMAAMTAAVLVVAFCCTGRTPRNAGVGTELSVLPRAP